MTFSPYDQSPLVRFLHFVSRSFRIGRAFRVEVRMYWAAAILMPLIFLRWVAPASGTALEATVVTGVFTIALFVIVWTHEMGHIAAGRRFGIATPLITLSPLGGAAHMGAPAGSPREEFWIALAGPAVHLLWLAVCWPLSLLLPAGLLVPSGWAFDPLSITLWFLVTTNTTLLLFNLLPVFALDGGRVLRSLLATRVHANRATLWATTAGFVGAGAMILFGLTRPGPSGAVLVVIGLTCIQACIFERRVARHDLIYQNAGARAPWESDPDAWRHGAEIEDEKPARPALFARLREERAARRARASAEEDARLDREVDAILVRLREVGLAGLSAQERATLDRASRRRRGAG